MTVGELAHAAVARQVDPIERHETVLRLASRLLALPAVIITSLGQAASRRLKHRSSR